MINKSFEGARGAAANLVALFHLEVGTYFSLIEYGYLFVDLFFVLSGFVIAAAYSSRLERLSDLQPFIIRRFGRLFPLMIFTTVLFVLSTNFAVWTKRELVALGYTSLFGDPQALSYVLPDLFELSATAMFAQGMGLFDGLILNYASWSVSVEFYVYLLFAAICVGLRGGTRLALFAVLVVVGTAVTLWASVTLHDCVRLNTCYDVSYDFGFARGIGGFFLGVLSCHLSKIVSFNPNRFQMVAFISLVAFFTFVRMHPLIPMCFPVLCALLVTSICQDHGFLARSLKHRYFQILGQRSYSIYLLHPVVLVVFTPVANVGKRISSPYQIVFLSIVAAGYIAILVIASGWTYARLELPCRDWFNCRAAKLVRRRSGMAMQR